jgi:hypothetical protein
VPEWVSVDDFNDPNGTDLNGKATETGELWTVHSNTMWTQDGKAVGGTDVGSAAHATQQAYSQTMIAEAQLAAKGGDRWIISVIDSGGVHHWAWGCDASNVFMYVKNPTGNPAFQFIQAYTPVVGDVFKVSVDWVSNTDVTLKGYINNVLLYTHGPTAQSAAFWNVKGAGMRGSDFAGNEWGWFVLTSYPDTPPIASGGGQGWAVGGSRL